jgi:hypothetical protein
MEGGYLAAVKHYENTASQLVRVRYGEDDYGIWAAGALWPEVDERQVAMLRASALSGDWRWRPELRPANYDFAGSQLVNNPGFPHLRKVAGLSDHPDIVGGFGGVPFDEYDDFDQEFKITAAVVLNSANRQKWAKSGVAMPDGSFPIPNGDFLSRAIARLGSAPASKRAAVKAHIIKRAKALGLTSKLPDGWTSRKVAAVAEHECTCGANDPDPILAALSDEGMELLADKVAERFRPDFDRLEAAITQQLVQGI